jgi:hypothetical protein
MWNLLFYLRKLGLRSVGGKGKKMRMEVGVAYLKSLSQHLLGEPEECYGNLDGEGGVNGHLLRKFLTLRG